MTDIPNGLTEEEILQKAEEIKAAQEAKRVEELKRAEEIRKVEEAKKAEELRHAEEIKKAEAEKKAEELKKAEVLVTEDQARKAAEAKKVQDAEKAASEEAAAKDEPKPKKSHKGLKIVLAILILLVVFAGIIIISADVNIRGASDKSYAYDTTYNVWVPLDKELSLGGYKIIALSPSSGENMMISLGGVTYPLEVNEVTYVPDQIATLTIFWGGVTVMQIQYDVDLTYLGNTDNKEAAFKMVISSNQQLPEFLISFFLSKSGVIVTAI